MSRFTRRYGLGFRGFLSAVPRYLAPPDVFTADSLDWVLSPNDGRWVGRNGSAVQGDTHYALVGVLESKWSSRCRQISALRSPSLTDGQPTHSMLYTNETAGNVRGTLALWSSNAGTGNYNLGKEFGSTHYSQSHAEPLRFRAVAMPYIAGGSGTAAIGWTRMNTNLLRRYVAPGARRFERSEKWIYTPNLNGLPLKWNKEWNDSAVSGTNLLEVRPWGVQPPLFCPHQGTETASTGADDKNWKDGDTFFVSCAFVDENGSISAPFTPRKTSAIVANTKSSARGGLWTIGTVRSVASPTVSYFRSVTWTNIPIGPFGTKHVLLLRTNKINRSIIDAGGSGQGLEELALSPLKIAWVVPNGTTSYIDTHGNDADLIDDDRLVRPDRMWPKPARHTFNFDQRRAIGYTNESPAAIIVAPTGNTTTRDRNVRSVTKSKNYTGLGVSAFVKVTATALELNRVVGNPGFPQAVGTKQSITLSGLTMQELVDTINETTTSSNAKEWGAALVPGADAERAATDLAPTYLSVASCTWSGTGLTTATAGGFADVAIGWKATVGAVTGYVTDKVSDTSLTMDTSGSATGTGTLRIDVGDDFAATNDEGLYRAHYHIPAILCLKGSVLAELDGYTDKTNIYFTQGAPGASESADEAFVLANRRKPPGNPGIFMGGAPLGVRGGAVLCYSRGIYILENRKGGNTGEDIDYRVFPINENRGCIAWDSVTTGDGWVGYLTRDGYVVTDGASERVISGDVWDPGTRRGDWDYEIPQSLAATEGDNDSSHFHAGIAGSVIHFTYRRDGTVTIPNRRLRYDYGPAIEGSGLAEVLRADGRPWGFSCPLTGRHSVIGTLPTSSYVKTLGAVEDNAGTTGDGRIDELDVPNQLYDTGESSASGALFTWTINQTTISHTQAVFLTTAVGAAVVTADHPAGTTVVSKATDQKSVVVSQQATATKAGNGSATFYGKEVEPDGYCATDFGEALSRKKSLQRFTAVYKFAPSVTPANFNVFLSRDKNRTSSTSYTLTNHASGDPFNREVVELTQAQRAVTEVAEFRAQHDGRGGVTPEFWGIEAEGEMMEVEG